MRDAILRAEGPAICHVFGGNRSGRWPLVVLRYGVPVLRTGLGNLLGRCPETHANQCSAPILLSANALLLRTDALKSQLSAIRPASVGELTRDRRVWYLEPRVLGKHCDGSRLEDDS